MRKKPGNIILFIFVLTIFVSQGAAQQLFKAAVVDSQKTLQNSNEGKKAIALLREKEQKINSELANLDKKIQDLDTKLKTQRLVMTFEAQEQLSFDLDNLRTRRKRAAEDSLKEWQRLQFKLFAKIREEVNPIIENVAKEKGFSLVLDLASNSVLYFSLSVDITDEVIKRYDALKITEDNKPFSF
jgi:Skp family chaperone for outer membrane proteins